MINERTREQILHLVNVEHQPIRLVARMLDTDRNTVRRCLRGKTAQTHAALSSIGKFLKENKEEIVKLYRACEFRCPPLQRQIEERFGKSVPLRMLQRFCSEIRRENQLQKLQSDIPTRFESAPGKQLQIDFGEKDVLVNGRKTRLHFFVCKLAYSRRVFAKAYVSETQAAWLDGLESAFSYFGGIPFEVVCDNATSLVRDHNAPNEELRFTERFYQIARYYDFKPVATAVRKPRSKGKVESGVKYLKNNLGGVNKPDLDSWNLWLENWCRQSDERKLTSIFDGPDTPELRWDLERHKLRPISKPRMVQMYIESRKVGNDGLIRVDNQYYRVDNSLIGRKVLVQIDETTITVMYGSEVKSELDKTADVFNPEQQETSMEDDASDSAFSKKLQQLQQDSQWQSFSQCANELTVDSRKYDAAVGWTNNQENDNGHSWN